MLRYSRAVGSVVEGFEADTIDELVALVAAFDVEPDDGWIEYRGGECPVSSDLKIEVKLLSGYIFETAFPERLRWDYDGRSTDIIAYRVVK